MTSTSVQFQDTENGLSGTLAEIAQSLPPNHITVRDLLAMIGEQGILFFCIILTIPFLTPIPLPGVSTVFGLLIMLVSLGVIFNRVPWMPRQLLDRPIASEQLGQVLTRGSQLFAKVERFIKPRMLGLTNKGTTNRMNGVILFLAGALLILPLPVIPLSNTIPGWAVLFLAAGMLQRDGIFVLIGYLLVLITFVYFGALVVAALAAGQTLMSLTQEAAIWLPLVTPFGT
jgi:hypothetical protein